MVYAAIFLLSAVFLLNQYLNQDSHQTTAELKKHNTNNRGEVKPYLPTNTAPLLTSESTALVPQDYFKETTDRIIIKYRDEHHAITPYDAGTAAHALVKHQAQLQSILSQSYALRSVQPVRETLLGSIVWQLDRHYPIHELTKLTTLLPKLDPTIEYAEPDARVMPTQYIEENLPDDLPWHLKDQKEGINVYNAWHVAKGRGITVAVIDTGYLPHPDLLPNIVGGYDMISDAEKSNKNGKMRHADATDPGDWTGNNECNAGSYGRDSSWHGTHVAGTIAALPNRHLSVSGIAYETKILPVRALGKCGGYTSDIADSIVWAAGGSYPGYLLSSVLSKLGLGEEPLPYNPHPAQVINMSLGGKGACSYTYQNAINIARNRGASIVVAAGNEAENVANYRPANCQGVITVAAYGADGKRAYYSNFGKEVTVAAPGSNITSTFNDGKTVAGNFSYSNLNGTSMATPHVAGVVALMLSIKPNLTPDQVTKILVDTAEPFPAGSCDNGCGAGKLNAAAAVHAAAQLPK